MLRISLLLAAILAPAVAAAQSPYYNQGRWRGGETFGGAIVGGLIGGAIGSMLAPRPDYRPQQPYYQPEMSGPQQYCMQRFRSYDPRTGYYMGYDGYPHPCP